MSLTMKDQPWRSRRPFYDCRYKVLRLQPGSLLQLTATNSSMEHGTSVAILSSSMPCVTEGHANIVCCRCFWDKCRCSMLCEYIVGASEVAPPHAFCFTRNPRSCQSCCGLINCAPAPAPTFRHSHRSRKTTRSCGLRCSRHGHQCSQFCRMPSEGIVFATSVSLDTSRLCEEAASGLWCCSL